MNDFPTLDELLDYGEDYKIPDLIKSDYFIVDNNRKQHNKDKEKSSSDKNDSKQDPNDIAEEKDGKESEDTSKEETPEEQIDSIEKNGSEQEPSDISKENGNEELEDTSKEETPEEQIDSREKSGSEQDPNDIAEEKDGEELEDTSKEETSEEQIDSREKSDSEQDPNDIAEEKDGEELEDTSKEETSEEQIDSIEKNDSEQEQSNLQEENGSEELEENDFDDLLNNYDESSKRENERKENTSQHNASDKINDITPSMVYKILKRLVSLSYETYQKGTYKYNKKEIIKHYLTEQKPKILDDLISPVFKPDVYVFDLSPSNDSSLEMYVNAISSVAIKGSLIYLTYNNEILRRLLIKKQNSKSINVKEVVNSENEKYRNFECTVYNEHKSLYEELKDIKDRKIYIFSDLDISSDMVELSKKNKNIVWFSTENNSAFHSFFKREVPNNYEGLYVDTKDITDIEKYIKEKNKSKYRRRHI